MVANPVADFARGLVAPITGIIEKIVPDADKAAQIAYDIATLASTQAHQQLMGQIEINKIEAAHRNWIVAGWRPFIGWVCGGAMFNNFLLATWFPQIKETDLEMMMPVLLALLGIGGLRTYEKVKGVAR